MTRRPDYYISQAQSSVLLWKGCDWNSYSQYSGFLMRVELDTNANRWPRVLSMRSKIKRLQVHSGCCRWWVLIWANSSFKYKSINNKPNLCVNINNNQNQYRINRHLKSTELGWVWLIISHALDWRSCLDPSIGNEMTVVGNSSVHRTGSASFVRLRIICVRRFGRCKGLITQDTCKCNDLWLLLSGSSSTRFIARLIAYQRTMHSVWW